VNAKASARVAVMIDCLFIVNLRFVEIKFFLYAPSSSQGACHPSGKRGFPKWEGAFLLGEHGFPKWERAFPVGEYGFPKWERAFLVGKHGFPKWERAFTVGKHGFPCRGVACNAV
jgi:hypothetical protein